MNILNLLKVSLKAVANNKMRSFLSMLGIIIGVAAVIIMMSIGQGSKESIRAELSTMGTNLLTIRPGADMRGGVRQDPSAMQTLKMADYERILREKRFVTKVSPEVTSSGQAIYGNNNTTTTIYGESPDYIDIRLWTIEEGECFTEEDIKKAAKKVIIGHTVVTELFGEDIAGMVDGVTKLTKSGNAELMTREDRQAENLRKMYLAMAKDVRVVIIKLADRTHNMRTMGVMPPEEQKFKSYETITLYAPLAQRLGMFTIKTELEDLSFKYLYPEEYTEEYPAEYTEENTEETEN